MASLKREHPSGGDADADAPPAKAPATREGTSANVHTTVVSVIVSNTDAARSDECADSVTPDVYNFKVKHHQPGDDEKPTRLQRAMAVIADKGYVKAHLYMRRKEPYGNPLWRALIALIEEPYYEALNEMESGDDDAEGEEDDAEGDEDDDDDDDDDDADDEEASLEDADAGDFERKVLPSVAAEAAAKAKAKAEAEAPYVMPVVTTLTANEFLAHMNVTRKVDDAQPCIEPLRLEAGERYFVIFVEPEVVAE